MSTESFGRVKLVAVQHGETTQLVRQARAGSAEALEALYGRCGPRLLAFIRLRLGRTLRAHLESRDILQATLLRSYERLGQFAGDDAGTFMAWLMRAAENEIRDRADYHGRQRRDAARVVPLDDAHDAVAGHVRSLSSRLVLAEEIDRLTRALAELSEAHREIILLRKFEELSFKAIAGQLGKSEDACRMLLGRAMAALTVTLAGLP